MEMMKQFESLWDGHLPQITVARHRIVLNSPNARPGHLTSYCTSPKQRELERKEVEEMREEDVAEAAITECASLILLTPMQDGRHNFCVDYRRLNDVTKRDDYPISRMNECIDSPCEPQTFSTSEANSRYWQIEMGKKDIDTTVFVTHDERFKYTRMTLRLRNTPATFQHTMDATLASVK